MKENNGKSSNSLVDHHIPKSQYDCLGFADLRISRVVLSSEESTLTHTNPY